ncbi:MAG: 1,4-alpha-glucan branching protein GlgB [Acidimicrobiales bacterium]
MSDWHRGDQGPVAMEAAPVLTGEDLYLFNEGTNRRLAGRLGARHHGGDKPFTSFSVWAPNARAVSVVGDFNDWDESAHPMSSLGEAGIWQGVVQGAVPGHVYKYAIVTAGGELLHKADPFALFCEVPPKTGSVIWELSHEWHDEEWMARPRRGGSRDEAVSIYEIHLGSWRRDPSRPEELLTYAEIAPALIGHLRRLAFSHVELLPVMEHPFYGSWGYQTTGYFAPSSRYGTPEELMSLIDQLHQAEIGVILDWVPSHFPTDDFALGRFDGTHLFEHADPRLGLHPDWNSYIFNYGRHEVRSFLLSSAEHWLSAYHADGLRVDAVASMLYLDYSRSPGEWIPNLNGGRENLAAISFLKSMNTGAYEDHPGIETTAEESTAWPGVSHPCERGGLGFGFKWDMGWMHDTLAYLGHDPVHRRYHHEQLTFRALYGFSENYVLPLSHDEVVHGKGSLLSKMPGDDWQRFANLRLLYAYQWALPGKKLLFMGDEIGQLQEWSHTRSLDWHLLGEARHAGLCRLVGDLNRLYRSEAAMHELDADPAGFRWVRADDATESTLSFLRMARSGEAVLVVCNFTPVTRHNLVLGVPNGGFWRELLNSDAVEYGGSGAGNLGGAQAQPVPWHDLSRTLTLTAPPLGCVLLKHEAAQ